MNEADERRKSADMPVRPDELNGTHKAQSVPVGEPWNTSPRIGSNRLNQIEIDSVTIPSDKIKTIEEDRSHHTVFTLEVRLQSGLRWMIEKRYSDFRELHEKLKRSCPEVKQLHFPKRHMFRSMTQTVIEQRRVEFQQYCRQLLEIQPFLRVPIFTFLQVYSHMESYERKLQRRKKQQELERMKLLLPSDQVDDLTRAFERLCVGKVDEDAGLTITKSSFRRDVLGVFPDIPTSFAMRFIRACSDKMKNDISCNEFLRAIAILLHGTVQSKLSFVFYMCDHDHSGKVTSSGVTNFLLGLRGRSFCEKIDCRAILNEIFDSGRFRFTHDEFLTAVIESGEQAMFIDWMERYVQVLIESADQELLELQEEFNPIAQQKILASETHFTPTEIAILQDAFYKYRSCDAGEVDLMKISDAFRLDLTLGRIRQLFTSFGKRAKDDIDIFSFVSALDIACRGSQKEKTSFAFAVFDTDKTGYLTRDDFFTMLQHELSLKSSPLEDVIWDFIETQKKMPDRSTSTNAILNEHVATLSGSQVGLYVDHVLKQFGSFHESTSKQLNDAAFSAWATSVEFQVGILDLMKQRVFVDLHVRPANPMEEHDVAQLCTVTYPLAPEYELIEDEVWYLIDRNWYEGWIRYLEDPATASKPSYISNKVLLADNTTVKPKDEIEFEIICHDLWKALVSWYGGGPEIARTVIVLSDGTSTLDIWGDEALQDEEDSSSRTSEQALVKRQSSIIGLSIRRLRPGGSAGLANLGNSCYMNASLQCLSNTSLLADYFLKGIYLDDINRTSTLGLQGKLAEAYGKLTCDVWANKSKAFSPRNFKKTIGKFNDAFRGNDQQDSQEFLAFLLSGLSEDLNRILDKPYVEQPDSDGRYDQELADEWWRNHLRREVSIIVALFTGQYKSLLTCCECKFESARFEPFSFLQVPLPEPTHHNVTIRMEFYTAIAPQNVSLRLPITATVIDLKMALVDICYNDFSLIIDVDQIQIAEVSGATIIGYKNDTRRLAQIRSIDRLVAFLLRALIPISKKTTTDGTTLISGQAGELVEYQTQDQNYHPALIVECQDHSLTVELCRSGEWIDGVTLDRLKPREPKVLYVFIMSRKLTYLPIYFKNPFRPVPFGMPFVERLGPQFITGYDLYCRIYERVKRFVTIDPPVCDDESITPSSSIFQNKSRCGFILRRVDAKGVTDPRSPWLKRSFGQVILCSDQLVDIVQEEAIAIDWNVHVLQNQLDLDQMKRVNVHTSIKRNDSLDQGAVPLQYCLDSFTSIEKIQEGYCSRCKVHREMTKKLDIWRLSPIIVIQLKRFQYTQTYRRKLGTLVEFPLYGLDLDPCVAPYVENQAPYPIITEDPIDTTAVEEKERDEETVEAPVRVPSPLTRTRRGYTDTNLEGGRCMNTKYDLYAVVNHLGILGGGHYTAYCKNAIDGHWYCYDDERVRVIEESKVVTSNAYLLFYIRTDMEGISINDLYPSNGTANITDEDIDRFVEQGDARKCCLM